MAFLLYLGFQWIWGSSFWSSGIPYISTFHLRVTLMTKIRIHLQLFRGRTWEGDAVQDLEFIWLFAGVGSHNIHIQTFPGLKCIEKMKKNVVEVVETLCTKLTKWIHKDLTTNLNFEWILPSKFSSDRPGIIALFCSLRNTETKLSSIKMCLGNFASRCDLANKPKNGISCCSLSDRPSVMTWAVAPSSSVAARSNNKVLPAFP